MKLLKIISLAIIVVILIWINLPQNVPVHFNFGSKKIQFTMNPLIINTTVFGIHIQKDFRTHLGLDLQGGSHLVFQADISKIKDADLLDSIDSARNIIERRVNLFGVSEPVVQTVKAGNNYRITVDLPGISNTTDAIRLIGSTAQLEFVDIIASQSAQTATASPLLKETGLTGKDVQKASVVFDPQTGKPQVSLQFTEKGGKLFSQITSRDVGKPLGIFIDGVPISTPVVQQPITDGTAVITGNFTVDDAKKLAIAINSGALPVPIQLVAQQNIGPSLGQTEIHKSILAGGVGLLMVMAFMIIYYGRLGVIACAALMIYGLISFGLFRAIPIVLTLPGVAGFILSIGMAVDSNILIFERIKEERRKGRDLNVAIKIGFGRALDAIKDANITTLIVAFILFNPLNWDFLPQFGLVRGFALTLAIGVATSLFTGVVITRRLITIFYKKG